MQCGGLDGRLEVAAAMPASYFVVDLEHDIDPVPAYGIIVDIVAYLEGESQEGHSLEE